MDGYRYWVERHKLLVDLANEKEQHEGTSDGDRESAGTVAELKFRERLDALYGQARGEFEPGAPKN